MNKNNIRILFETDRNNAALAPLRLVLGTLFIAHGAQKLFGWFGGYGIEGMAGWFEHVLGMSPGIFWAYLAGGGEFFGGILVLLGLATRFGALNIAVAMIVALVKVHHTGFFAPEGAEYVVTLLAISLVLAVAGGGRWSLDAIVAEKLGKQPSPAANQTQSRTIALETV